MGLSQAEFLACQLLAIQKKLCETSEYLDVADGDAIRGCELEELTNELISVGCGDELARGRAELGGDLLELEELLLFAGMECAQVRMALLAQHAATASVSEGKLAQERFVWGDSGTGGFSGFHGELRWGKEARWDPSPRFSRKCGKQRTLSRVDGKCGKQRG